MIQKIIQGLHILIIFAILKYKDTLRKIHISGVGKQKKKTGFTFARIQIPLIAFNMLNQLSRKRKWVDNREDSNLIPLNYVNKCSYNLAGEDIDSSLVRIQTSL